MPIEKVGRWKKEKFRFKTSEEMKKLEKAKNKYCDSTHDVQDFIYEFLGVNSSSPSYYLHEVKNGRTAISIESWNKIEAYVSTLEGE